jgi:hypothetical protein
VAAQKSTKYFSTTYLNALIPSDAGVEVADALLPVAAADDTLELMLEATDDTIGVTPEAAEDTLELTPAAAEDTPELMAPLDLLF